MTEAERKLWTHLRARQLAGVKFRRQHQIGPYIVDLSRKSLSKSTVGITHRKQKKTVDEATRW